MVDAVVAASPVSKSNFSNVSQNMLFEAPLSNLIVTAPHLHFCMYSIFIYVPFSKFLGTDILVTPICVLGQDNPDV